MAPYGTGHVSGCGGGCRPWARGLHAPLLHHMTPSIAATRPSWQDMYAQRPRLLFHGVYISKTSYMREGEPVSRCQCVCVVWSCVVWQGMDRNYSPYHLVEYYRYMRFFPDGTVQAITSSDDPQHVRCLPRPPSRITSLPFRR